MCWHIPEHPNHTTSLLFCLLPFNASAHTQLQWIEVNYRLGSHTLPFFFLFSILFFIPYEQVNNPGWCERFHPLFLDLFLFFICWSYLSLFLCIDVHCLCSGGIRLLCTTYILQGIYSTKSNNWCSPAENIFQANCFLVY